MLSRLHLKDFAIAAEITIELDRGLGVISGETGAGKSLLVDALLLLSGARADAGVVRHTADRAELLAEFTLDDAPAARAWLQAQELDDDDDCQLRRVIRADGGSRAWINGRPSTAGQLAELCGHLIEIHGQHEHQALLDRGQQLALLDAWAGHQDLVTEVAQAAGDVQSLRRELLALRELGEHPEQLPWLQEQIEELSALNLHPPDIEALQAEVRRQHAGAGLLAAMQQALDLLGDEHPHGSRRSLRQALLSLHKASSWEPGLQEVIGSLDSAAIQLDEACAGIVRLLDGIDPDPQRLQDLEAKLGQLHDLARKHRAPLAELEQRLRQLKDEASRIEQAAGRAERLGAELADAEARWQQVAARLSGSRRQAAQRLCADTSALMDELGMAGGRVEIEFEPLAAEQGASALGAERIEWLVSTNPGQPPRPLRRVASGGELARISLAIEVAALGADAVPTMVFDEVDSGIGGAVAEVVGRKLRALAAARQVLCVTHLPQVAAQGHYHCRVQKNRASDNTFSLIERLEPTARVEEIARMLGGIDITPTTREHARQMLEGAAAAPR